MFDVAVIGAGLAGLSAARSAVRNGVRSIVIIEGQGIGSNRTSPLTFSEVLQNHGLADCVKQKYSDFSFHNKGGSSVTFQFRDAPLALLDYRKACEKIFADASARSKGIELVLEKAAGIDDGNGEVFVRLKNGECIQARIAVDATGCSRLLNSQKRRNGTEFYSHVCGARFSGVDSSAAGACCYLLPGRDLGTGGGWFYSIGESGASFGYAHISNSPQMDLAILKNNLTRARTSFKPFSGYLGKAEIDYLEFGTIPISYSRELVAGNVLVAGDSAGMATNWTCMGIEPALKYGSLAGEVAARVLLKADRNALLEYQRAWDANEGKLHDLMAKQAARFWDSDHYFWEWIIKNDLRFLTTGQLIHRLRRNGFLLSPSRALIRAMRFKIRSFADKGILGSCRYTVGAR